MRPGVSRDGDPHYPSGSQPAESACPLLPCFPSCPPTPSAFQAQVKPPSVRPSPPSVSSQPPKVALKSQRVALYNRTINAASILCCQGCAGISRYADECNGEGISVRLGALSCTALQGASPSLPPQSSWQSQSPGVYLSRKSCAQINLSSVAKITKPWTRGAKPVVTEITTVFAITQLGIHLTPTVYFRHPESSPWSKILEDFFAPSLLEDEA